MTDESVAVSGPRRHCLAVLALFLVAAGDPPPATPGGTQNAPALRTDGTQSAAPAATSSSSPAANGVPGSEVVAQRGDVRLTAAQLRDLVANAEPGLKAQLESNPAMLADFARQRVLNASLLADAEAKGWDQRPEVAQRANDARDAVILQSYVASLVPQDPLYPTDADLQAAYDANKGRLTAPKRYHLAQIVVTVPANAPPEVEGAARQKAADLRAQALKPKADFAALARKASQEASTAPKGGDVGWLPENQLLPAVREAVTKTPENGVTEPVRAPDGWHVIRVLGVKPAGPMTLDEAKPQLVQALRQARRQQAVRAYVETLLRQEPIQLNEIELGKAIAP